MGGYVSILIFFNKFILIIIKVIDKR